MIHVRIDTISSNINNRVYILCMFQSVESMWVLCCDTHTLFMRLSWADDELDCLSYAEVRWAPWWAEAELYVMTIRGFCGVQIHIHICIVWWIIYLEMKLNYFPNWIWFWYAIAAVVIIIIIIVIVLHCIALHSFAKYHRRCSHVNLLKTFAK